MLDDGEIDRLKSQRIPAIRNCPKVVVHERRVLGEIGDTLVANIGRDSEHKSEMDGVNSLCSPVRQQPVEVVERRIRPGLYQPEQCFLTDIHIEVPGLHDFKEHRVAFGQRHGAKVGH